MMKRCWSFLLCFCLAFTLIPFPAAKGVDSDALAAEFAATSYEVTGTNSVGKMFASLMSEEQEVNAETESRGYGISEIVMDGSQAEVAYLCADKAFLMVAVYDEQTNQMTAVGTAEAEPNGETATVSVFGTIPEFYMVSAFMLDLETFAPLCEKYATALYTQPMQELLASTADDYDAEQVLNLDGNADSNFLVYDESVTQLEKRAGANDVSYQDGVCTIESASADTKSLRPGDIFSYRMDNDEILIIKVASVQTNGDTVVITEDEDIDLEEVFSVIKIDSDAIDEESANLMSDDEVEYNSSVEIPVSREIAVGSISGSLRVSAKIRLYRIKDYTQFELKFINKLNVTVSLEGSVSATVPLLDMPKLFAPVRYVLVSIEPSFIISATGKIEGEFELHFSFGKAYETGAGWKNVGDAPKLTQPKVTNLEGSLFIGLSLETEVELLHFDVKVIKGGLVSAKLKTEVGLELKANSFHKTKNSRHDCDFCVGGDANLKVELSGSVDSPLKFLRISGTLADFSRNLGIFYFSIRKSNAQFGWGECPYRKDEHGSGRRPGWDDDRNFPGGIFLQNGGQRY